MDIIKINSLFIIVLFKSFTLSPVFLSLLEDLCALTSTYTLVVFHTISCTLCTLDKPKCTCLSDNSPYSYPEPLKPFCLLVSTSFKSLTTWSSLSWSLPWVSQPEVNTTHMFMHCCISHGSYQLLTLTIIIRILVLFPSIHCELLGE